MRTLRLQGAEDSSSKGSRRRKAWLRRRMKRKNKTEEKGREDGQSMRGCWQVNEAREVTANVHVMGLDVLHAV